jgi:SecD/SecF fusion protein
MITSLTTILTILVVFILGGEVIRGFAFALLIGIGIGTYSSVWIATPVVYETLGKKKQIIEK